MNEEELKEIWRADQTAPTIDFAVLQKSLNDWQDKLRRKIKIDIAVQFFMLAVLFVFLWFFPKLFFLFWAGAAIAVWYVWEIQRFYGREKRPANPVGDVKQTLEEKLLTLKNFIRRVRVAMYFLPLVLVPAASYALGYYESGAVFGNRVNSVIFTLAVGEITAIILTEIYFKIFYTPAIRELKDLLRQLDSAGDVF